MKKNVVVGLGEIGKTMLKQKKGVIVNTSSIYGLVIILNSSFKSLFVF